ncbi:MAG: glycosyltransferase [Anaerolineae bacterium]|nr:glycosyltransferase [Anaerolineae bacterium]
MMPLFAVLGAPQLKAARVPVTLWYTHRSPHWTVRAAVPLVRRVVTAAPDSFPISTPKLRVLGHGVDMAYFSPNLTPQPPLRGDEVPDSPHPPAPSPEPLGLRAAGRRGEEIASVQPGAFSLAEGEGTGVGAGSGGEGRIVHVARLMPIKHQATLIRAVAAVPETRAVLVGDVPPGQDTAYPGQLAALAAELGVEDRVTLAGAQSAEGVRDAYRTAFAAVNLSPPGLFDKAALEAMACAVPTLVTNPAFDDLLGGDVALLRTEGPDDADGLAERLRTLLVLPAAERAALGLRLRERTAAAHSLDGLIERLVRVLKTGEPA